jgi:AAHS family 4-hydroxybenzoate transporter-like MFS transporter
LSGIGPSTRITVDVSAIIERQKLSGFLIGLVLVSWIITFFDGLDANLVTFAAPYFRSEYGLTTIQTGNIFGMHQLGTLIGGFLLGYLGDRIGRRPTVILATAAFGVLTMCFYFTSSYGTLFWLRLIDGIPLGGMLPLAWALNIEYAPKRYRATIVTVIMVGYSLGTALGGPFANWLIPKLGWKSVFISGGIAALVCALILFLVLPESIRFLTTKGKRPDRIVALLRRVAPGQTFSADANFVVGDEAGHSKDFKPSLLFKGELRAITPLIWIAYIASSFAVFFIVNWTPLVFEALHYARSQAATAATTNSIMGAIGGIILMRFTDAKGAIAITIMPVMTFGLLLVAAFTPMSQGAFLVLSAMIGGFLIGGHFGMHSISGIFYPTAYRGNGASWATSIAKIGSIGGPMVGGWVLATSLPVKHIFALLAIFPAIFAVCIYIIGRRHSRMLGREAIAAVAEPSHAAT